MNLSRLNLKINFKLWKQVGQILFLMNLHLCYNITHDEASEQRQINNDKTRQISYHLGNLRSTFILKCFSTPFKGYHSDLGPPSTQCKIWMLSCEHSLSAASISILALPLMNNKDICPVCKNNIISTSIKLS
jgi:hypothetical protein